MKSETIALVYTPQRLRNGHVEDRWQAVLTGPRRLVACGMDRREALANLGLQLDAMPCPPRTEDEIAAAGLKPWNGLPGAVVTGDG